METIITKTNLTTFINNLIKSGRSVIAPVKDGNLSSYRLINSFKEIVLGTPLPTKSAKEYFLAENEPILSYSYGPDNKIKLEDPPEPKELILFGVRPCEAISLPIMDKVNQWDYQDDFYLKRRDKTTVISVACESSDGFCFCTSVGVTPQTTEGSDILLSKPEGQDYYRVKVITDKGKSLVESQKELFIQRPANNENYYQGPEFKFNLEAIRTWLENNFDHPIWNKITLPCIGCGVCTFLCPTCHCFDIVDEATRTSGTRYKNWDACQFAKFTVHASGHNPRDTQSKRFRQRVMHKFSYYPEKFNRTLCVGCGRCIRHCPVDMSLLNVLVTIDGIAKTS